MSGRLKLYPTRALLAGPLVAPAAAVAYLKWPVLTERGLPEFFSAAFGAVNLYGAFVLLAIVATATFGLATFSVTRASRFLSSAYAYGVYGVALGPAFIVSIFAPFSLHSVVFEPYREASFGLEYLEGAGLPLACACGAICSVVSRLFGARWIGDDAAG